MKTKFFQTKLMLLVAMLIGGANMAFAQDVINSLPESEGYRSYWKWVCETPTSYNRYRIANAEKTANNKLYTLQNSGISTSVLNNCELTDASWVTFNTNYNFSPNFVAGSYSGVKQLSTQTSGSTIITANTTRNNYIYGINNSNQFYAAQNSANNQLWDFYSEDQCDCFADLKAAHDWAEENFDADIKTDQNHDVYKFLHPATPFQGNTMDERMKVYNAIAKVKYWYNTIYGYNENNVQVDLRQAVPWGRGNGPINSRKLEGWETTFLTHEDDTTFPDNDWANDNTNCWTAHNLNEYGFLMENSTTEFSSTNPFHELRNVRMYKQLTDLPNGVYEVSMVWQASPYSQVTNLFNDYSHHSNVKLIAKTPYSGEQTHDKQYGNGVGWKKYAEVVVVTDGTLDITIESYNGRQHYGVLDTKINNRWTNIDNIQIKYLRKYEETTPDALTKKFDGVVDGNDNAKLKLDAWQDEAGNKYYQSFLDLTDAALATNHGDVIFNKDNNRNGICYAAAGANISGDNVVKGGTCANLHLYDKYPYRNKTQFTATNTYYDMSSFGTGTGDDKETVVTYGTMMLPYAVTNLNGVAVYKVEEGPTTNTIKFTQVYSIEANKPYLIKYTGTDATPLFPANNTGRTMTVDTGDNTYSNGLLVGAYQLTDVPKDNKCYLLQKQSGRIAFFRVNKDSDKTFNIGPFRAYLQISEAMAQSAPAKISIITDDEPTGIVTIDEEMQEDGDGMIYDISGRRVENMNHRGFYIKNGKKILVK